MKTCTNCLYRHGLNLGRCIECWDKPGKPNWKSDRKEEQDEGVKVSGQENQATNENFLVKSNGQYIGQKDKNGRDIYEGDIVRGKLRGKRGSSEVIGEVVWGSDSSFFVKRNYSMGYSLNNADAWLEVVGNIHDNPDLLRLLR